MRTRPILIQRCVLLLVGFASFGCAAEPECTLEGTIVDIGSGDLLGTIDWQGTGSTECLFSDASFTMVLGSDQITIVGLSWDVGSYTTDVAFATGGMNWVGTCSVGVAPPRAENWTVDDYYDVEGTLSCASLSGNDDPIAIAAVWSGYFVGTQVGLY